MNKEIKLLPCPFCGGKAKLYFLEHEHPYVYRVGCIECKTAYGYSYSYSEKNTAIKTWNTRHKPEEEQQEEKEICPLCKGSRRFAKIVDRSDEIEFLDEEESSCLTPEETVCPFCEGLGHREYIHGDPVCDNCNGTGFILKHPKPQPETDKWKKIRLSDYFIGDHDVIQDCINNNADGIQELFERVKKLEGEKK